MSPAIFSPYLWVLTILLAGRVVGQLIVARWAPRWLPPMEQWQSGLLPYPALVAGQAVVLTLMVWISTDFSRGEGYWVQPHPHLGRAALWWSYLYFGAMVVRYVIRMTRRPDQRWLGGTIPIIFHSLVALFQWMFGTYHVAVR
ncbi:MAG TPA: hypothetical protein VES67_24350 [Vicinamibacterales bacterium]|nr:hypothetical protein [Vicinamibacterales bacterium]